MMFTLGASITKKDGFMSSQSMKQSAINIWYGPMARKVLSFFQRIILILVGNVNNVYQNLSTIKFSYKSMGYSHKTIGTLLQ